MVNLITGPKGSGKTQVIIDLANEKVKTSHGNVVLIKKSKRHTAAADLNIRVICMESYPDILTQEELVGFLYGMVAGNHDIDHIFIDGTLKLANNTIDNLPDLLKSITKISKENNIDFFLSVAAERKDLASLDEKEYHFI